MDKLEEIRKIIGDNAETKVIDKINTRVGEIITTFDEEIKTFALIESLGLPDTSYGDFRKIDIEEHFFKEFKKQSYDLDELAFYDIETFVEELQEVTDFVRRTRREINILKELLL